MLVGKRWVLVVRRWVRVVQRSVRVGWSHDARVRRAHRVVQRTKPTERVGLAVERASAASS